MSCDELGDYYQELRNATHCEPCPAGTQRYLDLGPGVNRTTCQCKKDFWRPDGLPGRACKPCPEGGECKGRTFLPYALPSHFGQQHDRRVFLECGEPDSCLGGDTVHVDSCLPGYSGPGCAYCSEAHYHFGGSCVACPAGDSSWRSLLNVLVFLGISSIWILVNFGLCTQIESFDQFFTVAQIANIIGSMSIEWPDSLQTLFTVTDILDFDVDIVSFGCLGTWRWEHNLYLQMMLPIFVALFLLAKIAVIVIRDKLRGKVHTRKSMRRIYHPCLVVFFSFVNMVYVTISKYGLDGLACTKMADGTNVLSENPEITCWSREHLPIVAVSVIGLLLYMLGYPLVTGCILWYTSKNKLHANVRHLSKYAVIYGPYKVRHN